VALQALEFYFLNVSAAYMLIAVRVTRRLEKKLPNFCRNSPKSCHVKKGQNIYNKPLFETLKYLQQTIL
jgi:hypothetical protein